MSRDSSDGLLARLGNALRSVFYSQIPDHPSHGGNTGDTEWSPEDAREAAENDEEQE